MTDSERIARLEVLAEQHDSKLDAIAIDVRALLETKWAMRGALTTIAAIGGGVSAVVSILIAIFASWLKR